MGIMVKFISILFVSIFSNDHEKGTDHWIAQRLSSIIIMPLTGLFFVFFLTNYGSDYEQVKIYFLNPVVNFISIIFFVITFLHLKQGLEVVIEDYISNKWIRKMALQMNSIFCLLMGLLGSTSLLALYVIN